MPINLQGSGNIAEGWGPPPQLHAPEIGSLVGAILRNRLGQQELTQQSIAATIKQLQEQRQSAAYTDALQKAGLLPEGDYGGLGIKGGESLADMIQRQQAEKALEAHRAGLLGIAQQRVSGGGGGGDGHAQGEMWIDEETGLRMIQTKSGPHPVQQYAQPNVVPQKQAQAEAARPVYDASVEARTELERKQKDLEERFGGPPTADQIPGLEGPRKARVQAKYLKRLKEITDAKKRQEALVTKYPGLSTPSDTGDTGGGGGGASQGYKVGDPVTLKDGSTHKVIAVNPDGSYQVD